VKFKASWLIVTIVIYFLLILSLIKWGLPNESHPYTYHMDEWHQLHSVKAVFKYGTPNVEKAAYGPLFHFFLSGIYLLPFMALGIINPFLVKSDFTALAMQARIFEILRLNTLIFGILSIILLAKIVKDYFKINPLATVIFFTFTPIWLSLSNYFKYDIALIFWILLALFFLLRYEKTATFKNFLLAAIPCGLALSTKISALPIVLVYLFAYFLFTPRQKWNFINLFKGISLLLGIFLLAGIPYIFYTKGGFKDFFYYNLVTNPNESLNYNLGMNFWSFLFLKLYPTLFGHFFYWIFIVSFFFFTTLKQEILKKKTFQLILFSFIVFFISLIPLKLFVSNRGLLLLPFMTIIVSLFVNRVLQTIPRNLRLIFALILTIGIAFQIIESFSWILIKMKNDPREVSSLWIIENIPEGTLIGVEDIVVYQMPPNIILREYTMRESGISVINRFRYKIVDAFTEELPPVVVITDRELVNYQKKSPKKALISRLRSEGYVIKAEFQPNFRLYEKFSSKINFYLSGLVPSPTITVYTRQVVFACSSR